MDFKGYFITGDGLRCDPFTITDAHSRYLIRCQTVSRMDLSQVRAIFYRVFFRDVEIGEFDVEALRFRPVQVPR
jgi:hypothetical protein